MYIHLNFAIGVSQDSRTKKETKFEDFFLSKEQKNIQVEIPISDVLNFPETCVLVQFEDTKEDYLFHVKNFVRQVLNFVNVLKNEENEGIRSTGKLAYFELEKLQPLADEFYIKVKTNFKNVVGEYPVEKTLPNTFNKKTIKACKAFKIERNVEQSWMPEILTNQSQLLTAYKAGKFWVGKNQIEYFATMEDCLFLSNLLKNYCGSESIDANQALESLKLTKQGEINFTPSCLKISRVRKGVCIPRKHGNQYILRHEGSWVIVSPSQKIIKTIAYEQAVLLFNILNEMIRENWNATSYEPTSFEF